MNVLIIQLPEHPSDLHHLPVHCSSSRYNKTFKPKKNIPEGSRQHDLIKHAAATLGSGNLRQAVQLPEGEDLNEWVAVNSECQINLKLSFYLSISTPGYTYISL